VRALWRSILVFVVLGAVSGGATARAGFVGHKQRPLTPASQVVLGSSFSPIGANATDSVWTSGDYLLSGAFDSTLVLTDDRTGTTTALDPQCTGDALGPPWVLMSCPSTSNANGQSDLELYSIANGTSQTVTLSPGMPYCSSPPYDSQVSCSADAVGAYWIEWVAGSYHHLPTEVYFQNIQTGELRGDPTNATTFADLNSPGLAQRTCPGVRLMPNNLESVYDRGTAWGWLTPYGQFALAVADNGAFLERCGTQMRRLLTSGSTPLASNAGAIVWQAVPNHLSGLFLPSLQTFTIPLPPAMVTATGLSSIWLTSVALYAHVWVNGMVWRTASPSALPFNTSRPRLVRSSSTVTCMRGRWRNALGFAYAWRVNGVATRDAKPRLTVGKTRRRRSVRCSVTASNPAGTTTAASGQLHLR
jgi:hypothetical protein